MISPQAVQNQIKRIKNHKTCFSSFENGIIVNIIRNKIHYNYTQNKLFTSHILDKTIM